MAAAHISFARLCTSMGASNGVSACRLAIALPLPFTSSAVTPSSRRSHTTRSAHPRIPSSSSSSSAPSSAFPSFPVAKAMRSSASPHHLLRRGMATHSDEPFKHHPGGRAKPETVEETMARLESEARKIGDGGRDHVGPFPLGVGPSGRNKTWKSWRNLGLGGKLWRTTQQMGNLTIILVGAGLFVILAIALSTELFAKNSPSVLYSECIDMIRDSDALNGFLLPPMTFTHSPHSAAPTRGTAPVVHRAVRHPVSGRDHLILTFWVHGRGRDEPEPLSGLKRWWAKGEGKLRRAAMAIGLVPADNSPENASPQAAISAADNEAAGEKAHEIEREAGVNVEQGPGFLGRLTSAFAFRGPGASVRSATRTLPPPGTYKVGEVRADYVKNASGHYTMLALVVDVPSSRAPYPGRAVVYWSPEADREGLVGRKSG